MVFNVWRSIGTHVKTVWSACWMLICLMLNLFADDRARRQFCAVIS